MSHSDPLQRPVVDAARGDTASTPSADRSLPEFPRHAAPAAPKSHSPIDREIERSQRASAALAAARALARASFTDSQLAAEGEPGDADSPTQHDAASWVRTEYASLDQSVRAPQDGVPHGGAPRNLVGVGFNPGMAFQDVRAFPGPSIAHTPIKTRSGAQARFLHESRQSPRVERGSGVTPRNEHSLGSGAGRHDQPAVHPMLATPGAAPAARPVGGPVATGVRGRASSGEPFRFALAAGLGAAVVLIGGGVAWKSGWLARSGADAVVVTTDVAAQAEAARVLSTARQEIAVAPPAAGMPPTRSNEEVDAALAAAARAAAVPRASVQAAGPARVARSEPPPAPVAVVAPAPRATPAVASASAARAAVATPGPRGKDSVAAAIANAQARADSFLAGGGAPSPAAVAAPEVRKAD